VPTIYYESFDGSGDVEQREFGKEDIQYDDEKDCWKLSGDSEYTYIPRERVYAVKEDQVDADDAFVIEG
jgi:hypothetical protein